MANNRQGRQMNNKGFYSYGNAAYDIDVVAALEAPATGEPLRELKARNKEEKRNHVSFGNVLFLVAALVAVGYSLVSYLTLQSEIASMNENIAVYETRLNNLTLANDDEYSKMIETVNLDEIRTIAISELGMVYPNEDQIVSYVRENSDYVRQVNELTN